MKAILATGELQTLENVARASWVCMMAGADFIKTSTGKEGVNATLEVSLVMVRAIRESARARSVVRRRPRLSGIRGAACLLSPLWKGEARESRLPWPQSALHQALRLLRGPALPQCHDCVARLCAHCYRFFVLS